MLSGASDELASLLNKRRSIAECSTAVNTKEPKENVIADTDSIKSSGKYDNYPPKYANWQDRSVNSETTPIKDNVEDTI